MQTLGSTGFPFLVTNLVQGHFAAQLDGRARARGHEHILVSLEAVARALGDQRAERPQGARYSLLSQLFPEFLVFGEEAQQLGLGRRMYCCGGGHRAYRGG